RHTERRTQRILPVVRLTKLGVPVRPELRPEQDPPYRYVPPTHLPRPTDTNRRGAVTHRSHRWCPQLRLRRLVGLGRGFNPVSESARQLQRPFPQLLGRVFRQGAELGQCFVRPVQSDTQLERRLLGHVLTPSSAHPAGPSSSACSYG